MLLLFYPICWGLKRIILNNRGESGILYNEHKTVVLEPERRNKRSVEAGMREEEKPEKQVEHTPDNASEESQKKEEEFSFLQEDL